MQKNFTKQLFAVMLPIVVQNLLSALVNTVDVFMLSAVSQEALGASSQAGQVTFVLTLFYFGLTLGAGVLVAQYWGKHDTAVIADIQGLVLRYCEVISLVFFVLAVSIPKTLLSLFTPDPVLIDLGARYLRVLAVSYLMMGVSQVLMAVMKSMEQTRICAVITTVSMLTNIALNALSIYVLFRGNEAMALMGVAAATVVARLLEMVLVLIFVKRGKGVTCSRAQLMRTPKWLVRDFWKTTLPVQGNYLVWGCATATNAAIIGQLGSDAVAANALAMTLRGLVIVGCTGFGTAASILLGKALGANKLDEGRRIGKLVFVWSLITGALAGVLLWCIRVPAVAMAGFEGETVRLFTGMLAMNAVYCIGKSFNLSLISGVFTAGGDTKFGFICDVLSMWCYMLPLAMLGAFVWHWPALGVYAVLSSDEFVKIPFVIRRFLKYKWVKNLTR